MDSIVSTETLICGPFSRTTAAAGMKRLSAEVVAPSTRDDPIFVIPALSALCIETFCECPFLSRLVDAFKPLSERVAWIDPCCFLHHEFLIMT